MVPFFMLWGIGLPAFLRAALTCFRLANASSIASCLFTFFAASAFLMMPFFMLWGIGLPAFLRAALTCFRLANVFLVSHESGLSDRDTNAAAVSRSLAGALAEVGLIIAFIASAAFSVAALSSCKAARCAIVKACCAW